MARFIYQKPANYHKLYQLEKEIMFWRNNIKRKFLRGKKYLLKKVETLISVLKLNKKFKLR